MIRNIYLKLVFIELLGKKRSYILVHEHFKFKGWGYFLCFKVMILVINDVVGDQKQIFAV
jgi:hypothetical protein